MHGKRVHGTESFEPIHFLLAGLASSPYKSFIGFSTDAINTLSPCFIQLSFLEPTPFPLLLFKCSLSSTRSSKSGSKRRFRDIFSSPLSPPMQLSQYNFILVVGAEEAANDSVNVRSRDNDVQGLKTVENLIEQFKTMVADKSPSLPLPTRPDQATDTK